MGKAMRAVIVIDFEAQSFSDAAEFEVTLKQRAQELCETIVDPSNTSRDDLCILNHQAGVLLAERRGFSGDINDIVFRGTRGPNHARGRVHIPKLTDEEVSKGFERHLINFRERLRREGRPTFEIQVEIDQEYAALSAGSIDPKVFRQYNKQLTE